MLSNWPGAAQLPAGEAQELRRVVRRRPKSPGQMLGDLPHGHHPSFSHRTVHFVQKATCSGSRGDLE